MDFSTQRLFPRPSYPRILLKAGSIYTDLVEYVKALEYYSQALSLARTISDSRLESTTLNNIGAQYSLLREYSRALEYFNQALPLARTAVNRHGEAVTLADIADLDSERGDYAAAVHGYQQALALAIRSQILPLKPEFCALF